MTEEKKTFRPINSDNVCQAYELLRKRNLVSFPLTQESRKKTEAIVVNITSAYFGVEIYPTAELKAVAYLYFLIKGHPFTDGNKRTAVLTFEVLCDINELIPNYTQFSLDTIAVFIEQTRERDHQNVIQALSKILFS